MNLSVLLPAGLFALGALLLPLLIHLQRRRETPPPRLFAALAYIDPQARPKRRLRLRDLPLLLLRLLLLALLALLLAQPQLFGSAHPPWVLLWPGVDPALAGDVDAAAELRWLAPGFPRVDATAPPPPPQSSTQPSPASLLRQLAFERPLSQALEIRLPASIAGLDGARLELGRALTWTVLGDATAASTAATNSARSGSRDHGLAATDGAGAGEENGIEHTALSGTAPRSRAAHESAVASVPLRVAVLSPGATATPAERVIAALRQQSDALGAAAPLQLEAADDAPAAPPPVALMQLGDAPLPPAWQAWLEQGGRVLRLLPQPEHADHDHDHDHDHEGETEDEHAAHADQDAIRRLPSDASTDPQPVTIWQGVFARLSLQRVGRGELRTLECDLRTRCLPELLDADFPQQLARWLAPLPAAPDHGDAAALTPLASGPEPQPVGWPLRDALTVLLLLLFAAERWLAASRRPA